MFSEDKSKVLLILKDRPKWQKGKLNGIGGKFDPSQDHISHRHCQMREFEEETGIKTEMTDWEVFAIISGQETENKTGTELGSFFRIYCYRAFSDKIFKFNQPESEHPVIIDLLNPESEDYIVYQPILPNVNWLIPMALYHHNSILEIKYN